MRALAESILDVITALLPRLDSQVALVAQVFCGDLFSSKYTHPGKRRRAQASSFHHLLTLVSDRRIALRQDDPFHFSEIYLSHGSAFSADLPDVMGVAAAIEEGEEEDEQEEE